MKKYLTTLALAALAFSACSTDADPAPSGYGYVELACDTSTEVITRTAPAFTVPTADEFVLTITKGADFMQSWPSFADFVPSENLFKTGTYTAIVTWGNVAQEGVDKPYYAGATEFTIEADKTVRKEIVARLGNAQVTVVCTERFRNYFHDAAFTLRTAAGGEFAFTATDEQTVFVRPDASFTLAGSAFKQNGQPIELGEQRIASAAPQTLYTYIYDVSGAGSATVTVSLDDTVVEEIEIDTELNPNA